MYDKMSANRLDTHRGDRRGAAGLVTAAAEGRKIGRLVVLMERTDGDLWASLMATWQGAPMVTLVAGEPNLAEAAMAAQPGFFLQRRRGAGLCRVAGLSAVAGGVGGGAEKCPDFKAVAPPALFTS